MTTRALKIDIISDVVCPWCIIGYKRLEKALTMVGKIDFNIHWHPFELNPAMQEEGENLRSHLAAKYGTTLEGSIKSRANLTNIGESLGFKFDYYDEMMMYNTFTAHQLIRFAQTRDKAQEMTLRLFAAFFGERKNISDLSVLVEEATMIGLDRDEVQQVISSQTFAAQVRNEEMKWRSLGVNSVPTYIFNDQQSISGAHEPEALAHMISNQILKAG